MRGAPVEMEIDAVAVLRVGIFEIVGEAGRGRKFVAGRRIEIGVGAAEADRAVADTGIGEPRRTVIAGGSVVLGVLRRSERIFKGQRGVIFQPFSLTRC